MLADKTGALIATSGRFGAEFAGCPDEVVDVLVEYGERIGVAFQLADDLIDLASETGQSGKTPGTDLREGVPTLPVLLARASTDPADAELHELLDGDLHDDARHARALALLRVHPSLEAARVQTQAWADGARAALTRCRPARCGTPWTRWPRASSPATADRSAASRSAAVRSVRLGAARDPAARPAPSRCSAAPARPRPARSRPSAGRARARRAAARRPAAAAPA